MEEREYTCQYCTNKFIPKRRRIQKFCSNSCRVSFHRFKNVNLSLKSTKLIEKVEGQKNNKIKVEQVSVAGVANSAIGLGVVELAKNILTPEENKPATKGDLLKLTAKLKRYHRIKNLPLNKFGHFPCFDFTMGIVVYLKMPPK